MSTVKAILASHRPLYHIASESLVIDAVKHMVDKNYDIAKHAYSYSVIRRKLRSLIYDAIACNPENSLK